VIASFIGIKPQPELILLVCSRDILAATLKRLSMYVLRAKVKLTDATEQFALYGLAGTALAANGLDAATLPGKRTAVGDGVSAVSLYPADGVPRALWIAPAGQRPRWARRSTPPSGNGARCAAASSR
jgi:folate-binding Fe-S cluster repair protein YgfZ